VAIYCCVEITPDLACLQWEENSRQAWRAAEQQKQGVDAEFVLILLVWIMLLLWSPWPATDTQVSTRRTSKSKQLPNRNACVAILHQTNKTGMAKPFKWLCVSPLPSSISVSPKMNIAKAGWCQTLSKMSRLHAAWLETVQLTKAACRTAYMLPEIVHFIDVRHTWQIYRE